MTAVAEQIGVWLEALVRGTRLACARSTSAGASRSDGRAGWNCSTAMPSCSRAATISRP